jgi:hypothetical protein
MSLSGAQHGLYKTLWAGVCAALGTDPGDDAARVAMHGRHGLPVSRARWGNEEFDVWKRECLAISRPADLQAQLEGQDQPCIRRRWRIRRLLARLGRDEGYLAEVVRGINLAARKQPQIRRPFETMTARELDRVIFELQREGRREQGQDWIDFEAEPGRATAAGAAGEDDVPF